MEYEIYNSDSELYHHGIRGMKWGVRRYQNKDGSLTNAGKKRRAKLEGELEKLGGKKSDSDGSSGSSGSGEKSVSEMSNKELQERTTRMQMEANYYNAQKSLASATPKQVAETKQPSKGKEFAQKFFKDNVVPAVGSAVKPALESYIKKQLGLETKDELGDLKRTFDILDYKQRIDKIKNPDKYLSWDDKKKKRDYDDETAKREKAAEEAKQAQDKYDEEMRNYREYNEKYANDASNANPRPGGEYSNSGGEKSYTGFGGMSTRGSSTKDSGPRTVEGTVEGVGNSSRKNSSSASSSSNKSRVIDADPYEVMVVSNVPTATRNRGHDYIAGLLEEPKGVSRR